MKIFKNIFWRKEKQEPQPLRIEGVGEAPLTPEPDDAELAAQALLELMLDEKGMKSSAMKKAVADTHTSEYYHQLAERIRQAHEAARRRASRFVAFCEQELAKGDLPKEGPGSLCLLEAELMKRIDTVDREGGELKRRWQHCLADVTVRLMQDGMALDSTE